MIEAIKSILNGECCDSTKGSMELIDKQSGMTVRLKDLPQNGLLINVPAKGRAHLSITNSEKGLHKSCDKLLLIDREEHVDAYFIEMKVSPRLDEYGVPQAAAKQILYTTPAFAYLVSMAKVHCGESKKTKSHFVVIAQNKGRKKGVKSFPTVRAFQYGNENFKFISSLAEISLKHLWHPPT